MIKKWFIVALCAVALLPVSASAANTACVNLARDLVVGSQGNDVASLQNFLAARGYLTATARGYFGVLTQGAVAQFQASSSLSVTRYADALTRAKIAELTQCGNSHTGNATTTKQIAIVSPNASSTFNKGDILAVEWNASGVKKLDIDLMRGSVKGVVSKIGENVDALKGVATYKIPGTFSGVTFYTGSDYYVRVKERNGVTVATSSLFRIGAPVISFTNLSDFVGKSFATGTEVVVKWQSEGSVPKTNLYYGIVGANATVKIKTNIKGTASSTPEVRDYSYTWKIPSGLAARNDYYLFVERNDAPGVKDLSGTFSIGTSATSSTSTPGAVLGNKKISDVNASVSRFVPGQKVAITWRATDLANWTFRASLVDQNVGAVALLFDGKKTDASGRGNVTITVPSNIKPGEYELRVTLVPREGNVLRLSEKSGQIITVTNVSGIAPESSRYVNILKPAATVEWVKGSSLSYEVKWATNTGISRKAKVSLVSQSSEFVVREVTGNDGYVFIKGSELTSVATGTYKVVVAVTTASSTNQVVGESGYIVKVVNPAGPVSQDATSPTISFVEGKAAAINEVFASETFTVRGSNLGSDVDVCMLVGSQEKCFETASPTETSIVFATPVPYSIANGTYNFYVKKDGVKSNVLRVKYVNPVAEEKFVTLEAPSATLVKGSSTSLVGITWVTNVTRAEGNVRVALINKTTGVVYNVKNGIDNTKSTNIRGTQLDGVPAGTYSVRIVVVDGNDKPHADVGDGTITVRGAGTSLDTSSLSSIAASLQAFSELLKSLSE